MMELLLPLSASFLMAVGAVADKIGISDNRPFNFLLFSFIIVIFLMAPFSPFFLQVTAWELFLPVVAVVSVLDGVRTLLYAYVLKEEEASYCLPILSMTPVFTMMFSAFLVPQEMVAGSGLLAILVIVSSLYVINLKGSISSPIIALSKKNNVLLLFATVIAGVSTIFSKWVLSYASAPAFYFVRVLLMVPLFLVAARGQIERPRSVPVIVFGQVVYILAFIAYYLALSSSNLLVASTLSSVAPLFLLVFSAIFLHERVTWQKAFASFIVVVGIALLVNP